MKRPIALVDFNSDRSCEDKLVIARKGVGPRYYHPTKTSLARIIKFCRNSAGCTYPFPNGWTWLPDGYWEEK